jgi:pyruvate/2-oxoglutarate/acetoin dehydrogenase E1 component
VAATVTTIDSPDEAETGVEQLSVLDAVHRALAWELAADERVVVLGEDVGTAGGIFRATAGLAQRFGSERIIDTPLDEKGIAAHAIGMALYGLRPVVEIQFSGFIHDAFEQIMFCGTKYSRAASGTARARSRTSSTAAA